MKIQLFIVSLLMGCVYLTQATTHTKTTYAGKQSLSTIQSGDVFIACTFSGDWTGASFDKTTIIACDFTHAKLSKATFDNAIITTTVDTTVADVVNKAGLQGIEGETSFYNAMLEGASFKNAHIHASFDGANLTNAAFNNAAIMLSSFNFARLAGTDFLSQGGGHTSVILTSFICADGIDSMRVDANSIMFQLKASLKNQSSYECVAMRTALAPCKRGLL